MAIGPGSPSNPFSRTGFACGAARRVKGEFRSVGKTDNLFTEEARPRYFNSGCVANIWVKVDVFLTLLDVTAGNKFLNFTTLMFILL